MVHTIGMLYECCVRLYGVLILKANFPVTSYGNDVRTAAATTSISAAPYTTNGFSLTPTALPWDILN